MVDSQFQEIEKEISEAESMSLLRVGEQEVLNEEGLPIREIKEHVFDDEETRRGVSVVDEVPERIYTMEEIDRMMDEAEDKEQEELQTWRKVAVEDVENKENEKGHITALAGDGLDVGEVNGEELIAELMDESKKHYSPAEDIWDGDGEIESEEISEDEDEEETEDEFGRTRGYLIPPNLSKFVKQERGVKFASFEKPATPSLSQLHKSDKPVKSTLKKASASETIASTFQISSTSKPMTMAVDIVERVPQQQVSSFTSCSDNRIPRNKIPQVHAKSVDLKHLDRVFNQGGPVFPPPWHPISSLTFLDCPQSHV
jgi:hypothetical protein